MCSSERVVFMESRPDHSEFIFKYECIAQGGSSRVYRGRIGYGPGTSRDAVKVLRREPFVPWRKAMASAASHFMKFRKAVSRQHEAQVVNDSSQSSSEDEKKVAKYLSREEIQLEIDNFRAVQGNGFILSLSAVSHTCSGAWLITDLCVGDVRSIVEELFQEQSFKEDYKDGVIPHLLAPILDAIRFIHKKGYIHRDIKPSNILLNKVGIPKLINFGLCVQVSPGSGKYHPTEVAGSPYFMSPEAVKLEPMSTKSDAFSFAATAVNLRTLLKPKTIYSAEGYNWDYIVQMYNQSREEDYKHHNEDPSKQEEMTRYKDDYQTMKKYVVELARGSVKDYHDSDLPLPTWTRIQDDIKALIAIDVEQRGTLEELERNTFLKELMKDWVEYPFNSRSYHSADFMNLQGFIRTFLRNR